MDPAPRARRANLIGRTLAGDYILESLIGCGGMGDVYAARHTRLPARFAIKVLVLEKNRGQSEEHYRRFRHEAEILAALRHPNIVQVTDYNRLPDGTMYLVMELLTGEDLQVRLQRQKRLPLGEVLLVARQLAGALMAAHKQGVVHRDLKPSNLFLAQQDHGTEVVEVLKVLDFGISKVRREDSAGDTATGLILGTPQFMAPEQARGEHRRLDERTDQFAMAAIVYYALTGQLPFSGTGPGVIYQVLFKMPTPAHQIAAVPPALSAALERALAKEAEGRFPTMVEFVRALEQGAGLAEASLLGRSMVSLPVAALVAPERSGGHPALHPPGAAEPGPGRRHASGPALPSLASLAPGGERAVDRGSARDLPSLAGPEAAIRPVPTIELGIPVEEPTLPTPLLSEDPTQEPTLTNEMPNQAQAAALGLLGSERGLGQGFPGPGVEPDTVVLHGDAAIVNLLTLPPLPPPPVGSQPRWGRWIGAGVVLLIGLLLWWLTHPAPRVPTRSGGEPGPDADRRQPFRLMSPMDAGADGTNPTQRLLAQGRELLKSGDLAGARMTFEEVLRLQQPGSAAAYAWLGSVEMEAHDYAAARRWLREAVSAQPNEVRPHLLLCQALYRLGERDAALASCRRALQLDPANSEAQIMLRWIFPALSHSAV